MATPEEQEAARQQLLQAQIAKDAQEIVEVGQSHFGRSVFDEASQVVAEKLGTRVPEFMSIASQFDKPHEIIAHLSNNLDQAEALAKMPAARMATEMARIEGRLSSYGHVSTGAQPYWKQPEARTGRVPDSEWARGGGDNLSDAAWHKEFDRRMRERSGRVR